jgi:drug/metabolite transporter (DMT)-like permease
MKKHFLNAKFGSAVKVAGIILILFGMAFLFAPSLTGNAIASKHQNISSSIGIILCFVGLVAVFLFSKKED